MLSGILKSSTNTGADSDISVTFMAPLTIVSKRATLIAETKSLKRLINESSLAQRWEVSASIYPDDEDFMSVLFRHGNSGYVYIRPPQPYTNGVYGSGVITASAAGAGAETITMSNASLKKNSFIKFANHNKVYMVVDNSGSVVTITPKLQSAITNGTAVAYGANVTMRTQIDADNTSIEYSDGIMRSISSVKFIEAL